MILQNVWKYENSDIKLNLLIKFFGVATAWKSSGFCRQSCKGRKSWGAAAESSALWIKDNANFLSCNREGRSVYSIYYIEVYVHYVIFQERGITEFLRRQKCEKTEIVNDHLHCVFSRDKDSFFQYKANKVPKGQKRPIRSI